MDLPKWDAPLAELFQQSQAAVTNYVSTKVTSTLGVTLPSDRPSIPIRYNATTQTLSFIGLMTTAEQSALKLSNPDDYLLAESWERLRRTFYFIDNLNTGADRVKTFAAAAMTEWHEDKLKTL